MHSLDLKYRMFGTYSFYSNIPNRYPHVNMNISLQCILTLNFVVVLFYNISLFRITY